MNWMKSKSYSFTQFSILLHAPAKAGLYHLHTTARCIYVGEAENIRQTLLAHLRGDIPWITVWDPTGFSFELCSDSSRVERKKELASKLNPAVEDRHGMKGPSLETIPQGMRVPLARS
jgi:hypothetical protein